jgi:hypothetical protein
MRSPKRASHVNRSEFYPDYPKHDVIRVPAQGHEQGREIRLIRPRSVRAKRYLIYSKATATFVGGNCPVGGYCGLFVGSVSRYHAQMTRNVIGSSGVRR